MRMLGVGEWEAAGGFEVGDFLWVFKWFDVLGL